MQLHIGELNTTPLLESLLAIVNQLLPGINSNEMNIHINERDTGWQINFLRWETSAYWNKVNVE